ncbi:ABC transporter permease [Chelatococcus sp. GCM10030263]|uniref:ABC transporter permease n=1 Tax=Chelatococcus sp. GCM10030263 TaxID=3273387 RepID=UPI0036104DB6
MRRPSIPGPVLARITLVVVSLFLMLLPLVAVIGTSFFTNRIITFPAQGYTLDWYQAAWDVATFRSGFGSSIILALAATLGSLLVGVPAGFVLARGSFWGRDGLATLLLSPLMVPAIVSGTGAYLFFIQIELATGLQLAGTLFGLVLAHVVIAIPWTVRLTTASLIHFDQSVEEAATSLGASRWTVLRRITLPIIRPAIVASALFSFIVSFVELEMSLLLVGPDVTTLPIALVNYIEWRVDPAVTAVSTVQIVVVIAALVIAGRFVRLTRSF